MRDYHGAWEKRRSPQVTAAAAVHASTPSRVQSKLSLAHEVARSVKLFHLDIHSERMTSNPQGQNKSVTKN